MLPLCPSGVMVSTYALGAYIVRCGGSSPLLGTKYFKYILVKMTKQGPKGGGSQSDTAYVNELWLAYSLLGSWSGGIAGLDVEYQKYVTKVLSKTNGQVKVQQAQIAAQEMSKKFISWANQNGFYGNPTNVWWTAKSDFSWKQVSGNPDSRWESQTKNHPADVLCAFSRSDYQLPYLGLSAKMVEGKGDAPIKNPGVKKISQFLFGNDTSFSDIFAETRDNMLVESGQPLSKTMKNVPEQIWKKIPKNIGQKYKSLCLNQCRNLLKSGFQSKNQIDVRFYILEELLDTSKVPQYVKVTGNYETGSNQITTASANVVVPTGQNNSKFKALLQDDPIIFSDLGGAGGYSVGVSGGPMGDKGIIQMRWKFASSDFRTGLKMSIAPWSGTSKIENSVLSGAKDSSDTLLP